MGGLPASWVILLAAFLATPALGQDFVVPPADYPTLPAEAAGAEGFVPKGWRLEAQASGDLNKDGIADLAIVLQDTDPAKLVEHDGLGASPLDSNPRLLAVAFGERGGDYKLATTNHTLIPRRVDPVIADPLDEAGGIGIARGGLQIKLYLFSSAGSWDTRDASFTFRWQKGAFRLIGFDATNVQRNTGVVETNSVNYLTGKVETATGTIDSDENHVERSKIKPAPLLTLDEVGDGLAFDPGLE